MEGEAAVVSAPKKEGFVIRKSTMIRKNLAPIEDIYKIGKKPLGSGAYGVVS